MYRSRFNLKVLKVIFQDTDRANPQKIKLKAICRCCCFPITRGKSDSAKPYKVCQVSGSQLEYSVILKPPSMTQGTVRPVRQLIFRLNKPDSTIRVQGVPYVQQAGWKVLFRCGKSTLEIRIRASALFIPLLRYVPGCLRRCNRTQRSRSQ